LQHRAGRRSFRVLAGVGVAVVGEHDRLRGDAESAQPLDERETHRSVLCVHTDGCAGPGVRRRRRLERIGERSRLSSAVRLSSA
jgi:hypothetical protein